MKWIVNSDGYIVDTQTNEVICLLSKSNDRLRDKMIEVAPELFTAVFSFVEAMDSGKSTIRSTYNEFKEIFERVPHELLEDERLNKVA